MGKRTAMTDREAQAAKPGAWLWDGNVSGFGLRVTPGGVKTFMFRYRVNGVQKFAKIGRYGENPGEKSVKDARDQAKVWAGMVANGKDPMGAREAETLTDLADFYLKDYAPARGLKPITVKAAEIVLKPMLATMGGKRVSEITPADIRRAHSEAKTRKVRPVSAKAARAAARAKAKGEVIPLSPPPAPTIHQANRLLVVLSKMFSLAIEQGWRTDNPCRGVSKYKISRRERYFAEDEIGQLLAACDAYPNQNAANAIRLLLYTGARLNEALKAEWSQFDLEGSVWEKPSAHTKTKIVHRVPLSGPVHQLLSDMREANSVGRFVFPGASSAEPGKEPVERPRADLKRPWAQICKAAGIKNARRHDLRRTTASLMASAGDDRQTIGRVLGHTQAATTDSYVSVFQHAQAAAVKRVGERMAELRAAAPAGKVVPLRAADGDAASA
ncbi:tyrosine-type recombinase/integrase [Phenylobacterium sp.]|uniref:tyrosine-type recombinase/integrase n=1 Tax=Phenylobacterium sp. TaxID=1871053 RepID=UPI00356A6495